ncbi:hypothetical protein [Chitinophaga sp.]|uniref:hypothetical protein n=1 Tax=Chitinophaga sp. TaxID=1869181 RepID=UPI0031DB8A4A
MKTKIVERFWNECSERKLIADKYPPKAKRIYKWIVQIVASLIAILYGLSTLVYWIKKSLFFPGVILGVVIGIIAFKQIFRYFRKADTYVIKKFHKINVSTNKERIEAIRSIRIKKTTQLLQEFNIYMLGKINCLIKDCEEDIRQTSAVPFKIISLTAVTSVAASCATIITTTTPNENRFFFANLIGFFLTIAILIKLLVHIISNSDTQKSRLKDWLNYLKEVRIQLLSETPSHQETSYSSNHLQ